MKKTTILASIALAFGICAGVARADPPSEAQKGYIAHMQQECNGVMGKDVCRVQADFGICDGKADVETCRRDVFRERFPNGLIVPGVGSFTADEYYLYVAAGDRMCDVIARECSADYAGRGCKMARALWKQR